MAQITLNTKSKAFYYGLSEKKKQQSSVWFDEPSGQFYFHQKPWDVSQCGRRGPIAQDVILKKATTRDDKPQHVTNTLENLT